MSLLPEVRKSKFLPLLSTIVLFLSVITGVALVQRQQELRTKAAGATWYVSKKGNNSDGRSWSTAWNELDRINWSAVQSNDTILIDGGRTPCAYPTAVTGSSNTPRSSSGGSCGMVYTSTLTVGRSGATIRLASESGRNGSVVIFGGRSTPLSYCGQSGWNGETSGVRNEGIDVAGVSNVLIDGNHWSGIIIYGHTPYGIDPSNSSTDITIRNVEVFDNGRVRSDGDPDQEGVNLNGTRITFERAIIHDNGQDSFQSGGIVNDFTLRQSWVYNLRPHPTAKKNGLPIPWNHCRHSDGVQIYGGFEQYGVTIEESIIGPGFLQGLLLSGGANDAQWAVIQDVTIRDTLFIKAMNGNSIVHTSQPISFKNWNIERSTFFRQEAPNDGSFGWWNLHLTGSGHTIKDSVFYGGRSIGLRDGNVNLSGNCRYKVSGYDVGQIVNPQFANVNEFNYLSTDDDFTVGNPSCKGSSITSIAQLLGSPPSPQPTPGSSPTPTPKPTPTPGLSPTPGPSPTPAPSPTPLPGLSFEAENGVITSPFTVSGGYISQSIETDLTAGGRASYRFNLSSAGDYVVKALVDASSLGSNSFFVNIDGEPVSPDMIWDIGLTNGFEERTVSWRGSGTPGVNEFVPKVFTLTAGEHELIIRGRERDTKIDKITIEKTAASSCALTADINCDNVINILDFQILNNNFGTNNSTSDLNGDGKVNILDFQILSNNFGKT